MDVKKQMALQIKELRTSSELKQEELAQLAQVPYSTINRLENNKANPTLTTLDKILKVFGHRLSIERRKV